MTTPTLRQLDIFAQMVASGSIVDCARALGISPAAVESDMHALEQRLGHQLFFVDGRHIRLTAAGRKAVDAMALLAAREPEDWDDVQPVPDHIVDAEFEPVPDVDEELLLPEPPVPVVEEIEDIEEELLLDTPIEEPVAELITEQADASDAVEALNLADLHPMEPFEEELGDPVPEPELPSEPTVRFANDDDLAPPPIRRPAPSPVKPAVRVAFSAPAPNSAPLPLVVSLRVPAARAAPAASGVEPMTMPEPELVVDPPLPEPEPSPEEDPRQHVTIAAHPSIFGNLQDSLTAFEQTNSDVAIVMEMDSFTAADAGRLFDEGKADIAYFYAVGDPDDLASRYVWSEQMSLYVGSRHPLAKRDAVTAQDLLDIEPLLLEPTNKLRPVMERALGKIGLDLSAPAMESDNLFDIMLAVRSGFGYFAAFGSLARDFGKMSGIKRLPIVEPLPPVEVRQAIRADRREDPVVASLAEYLLR